jgi:hypothetical protein
LGYKLLHFLSFFNSLVCLIPLSELELSEPEPHRVTTPPKDAAPCGSGSATLFKSELNPNLTFAYLFKKIWLGI